MFSKQALRRLILSLIIEQFLAVMVGMADIMMVSSAGEAAVAADEFLSQASYTSVVKQTDALLEVKSGAADAAVMDFVLANTLAGTGDYSDLMVIPDLELSVEEYGIGFRQGSDLTAAVNQAMQELIDDGTLNELAVKYELADLLLANQ